MKRIALLFAALTMLATSGCDAAPDIVTPQEPQVVTGAWTGRSFLGRFELVLAQDAGGRVSGSGWVRSGFRIIPFAVEGANAFPNVSLALEFGPEGFADPRIGAELVIFLAEFDASRDALGIVGRLNGGFLLESPLRLERD